MASMNDWVSREDVSSALARVLAANDGDWDKVNANMVAVDLGKSRANKTIYKHFDDLKRERAFGAATVVPEPTPEQSEKYRTFCMGMHIEAGTFWMQDAERRLAGYRDMAEEANRDRDELLDYLDDIEASSETIKKEHDAVKADLQRELAAGARKDALIRDLEARLEEARRGHGMLEQIVAAMHEMNDGRNSSSNKAAEAAAALSGKDVGGEQSPD